MNTLLIFYSILFVLLILIFLFFFLRRKKRQLPALPPTPQGYEKEHTTSTYEFLTATLPTPFNSDSTKYQDQSPEWHQAMQQEGKKLQKAGVKAALFLHGTFAGDDPFDIVHLVNSLFPSLNQDIANKFKDFTKSNQNWLVGDQGNFPPAYLDLFREGTGINLQCKAITWSSTNHHLGRIQGCLDLIESLIQMKDQQQLVHEDRVLIIGHSHAGQVFALFNHFLAATDHFKEIIQTAQITKEFKALTDHEIFFLKSLKVDAITLGTPPRYGWSDLHHWRVLHFINHRGSKPEAGSLNGILTTKHGDYVQQLGISGSDSLSPLENDREINKNLEEYLGIGSNLSYWHQQIQHNRRLPSSGHTLLIDYQDNGNYPNCFTTLFGHAAYTRYRFMLFNLQQITRLLYS